VATCIIDHAIVALKPLIRGKHVYVQRPLTHSVYECQTVDESWPRNMNVATQMGIQGASGEGVAKT